MKVRCGFVSNSSSSSFIIHRSEFPSDEIWKQALKDLSSFRKHGEYGSMWGDNDESFEVNNNYLKIETYYVFPYIDDIFKNLNFSDVWKRGISLY